MVSYKHNLNLTCVNNKEAKEVSDMDIHKRGESDKIMETKVDSGMVIRK